MDFTDFPIDTSDKPEGDTANPFFDSLVRNAIDFLRKSVEELEKSPKYSVIHFCSALELFLKARLLSEHWTLIITDINKVTKKKDDTTRARFETGDFHSVGMDKCIERLRDICSVQIPLKAVEQFKIVRDHRNKMVHFYHPFYPPSHAEVVSEQWSAWFHLHNLISKCWHSHFQKFDDEIEELHDLVRGNRKYLKAKYDEIRPDIEAEIFKGVTYSKCTICGYESAKHDNLYDLIYTKTCRVCHHQNNTIHIKCPECETDILIEDMGHGECRGCGFETDIAYLISELGPYQDPKEDQIIAYCAECEHSEPSAIPIGMDEDEYLCLNCNTLHGTAKKCHYCNELIAGLDLEASYFAGCIMCKGSSGFNDS